MCHLCGDPSTLLQANSTPSYTKTSVTDASCSLSYQDFFEKSVNLKKYKIPELKVIAKQNKLHISGSKTVLIERITHHFNKVKSTILIQSQFRGWIVRYMKQLKGDAFKDKTICVNDTDFVTMEPLEEIEYKDFFSYKDNKDFCYGFNINSLIQLMKTQAKLINPYNREQMHPNVVDNIISLHKIRQIVYSYELPVYHNTITPIRHTVGSIREHNVAPRPAPFSIYTNPNYVLNDERRERLKRITDSRAKPINQRIQELFMEIDFLGNYTQSSWFSDLVYREYVQYYRCISDIWLYRGQLSAELKFKICPFFTTPFANIIGSNYNSTLDEIKGACISIMENIVYSGVDDEHRKIGALHALSALTIVSSRARQAMPWLYESVAY